MQDVFKQARLARLALAISSTVARVRQEALARLAGLVKEAGEPGYNPDAEKPPEEWGTRTRHAVQVARAIPEAKHVLERVLQRWPTVGQMLLPAPRSGRKGTKRRA